MSHKAQSNESAFFKIDRYKLRMNKNDIN